MASLGGFGGGLVGGATVKLLLDDSQFKAGLAEARGETQAAAGGMGKFGGAATAAFAVAGTAAVAFAASSLKAFEESEAVMAQFQNTLSMMPQLAGETTAAFQEQATALQNLTGYQDEEIISADNILARFKLTGEQIRQAIPIVLDYARATGTEVPAAAQNIGKALLGNTRALKTVGINFTATGDTAKDFNSILDLLQGKVGGAAEAFGDTLAGKIDIAKAKLDDFKENVGQFIGSQLLLLTGDLHGAASAWVQVANVTDEAAAAFARFTVPALDASKATGHLTAEQSAARTEMQHLTRETAYLENGLHGSQTAAEQAAFAAKGLADSQERAARAARNLYNAELALADGFLGLEGSALQATQAQRSLSDANATVTDLQEKGKRGTEEYKDAILAQKQAALDATSSQIGLRQAVQDYIAENGKSQASTQQAAAMIRQYGQEAGLTKGQVNSLIAEVGGLISQYGRVPERVFTDVRNNAGDNMDALIRYWQQLQAIPTHKDVYIVTHYSSVGTPGTAGGPQ